MTMAPVLVDRPASIGVEWRSIPGWSEYEISEDGRVRRARAGQGAISGRILKPWTNRRSGYLQIGLWRDNRRHRSTVHRLVATAFLGPPPTAAHVVAHLDGSRQNNHRANLAWVTQRENVAHTVIHGTHNRGGRNGQAKLDEIYVRAIRKMAQMGIPRRVAAEGFGVCRQCIDDIVNRRRWGHLR